LAWVFFRADSLGGALDLLQGLWTHAHGFWQADAAQVAQLGVFSVVFGVLCRHAVSLQTRVVAGLQSMSLWAATGVFTLLIFLVIALGPSGVPGFIYYRF
jgi:hypothetical protein